MNTTDTSKRKWHRWLAAAIVIGALVLLYRAFDLGQVLTLAQLKASRDDLLGLYAQEPLLTSGIYFVVYVLAAAISIPGAVILTLAGGAIFGFTTGLLLASFASSAGALIAFLVARYLLRDVVQTRFSRQLAPVNEGLQRDGVFYLLTLRLVPVFPYWLVNLLMGLTTMGAVRYYVVSQLGMLPATAVFVLAGTQLAGIQSPGDVLSAGLLASLVLLGIFPLLAKWVVTRMRLKKIYAGHKPPKSFDRNLVVIGAGAGGLVTAYIAAAVKAKVTIIEGHKMGGDCLNYGCVPSKALIRCAKVAKELKQATRLGFKNVTGEIDFAAIMQRVHGVIQAIEPHDSVERYTALGVQVLEGHALITSPWHVQVTLASGHTQTLSARNIVIASGASARIPDIAGLSESGYLTSETIWQIKELPKRLVVLGGGPIGCELAQSFARLGSQVVQVESHERLLSREDPEVSQLVRTALTADGVEVLTAHQAVGVLTLDDQSHELIVRTQGQERRLPFDQILVAVGREPRVKGFGLEALGIGLTPQRTIQTNAYLQTIYPNIFAVGDVAGPFQLTHAAAHQAWYAAVNALFAPFKRFKADYRTIPWCTFTDPEVARVGLSETQAKDQGVAYTVTRYDLHELDRAIADDATTGFVKVLTVPGKDKILGAVIVGAHAGDLLAEFVLAMRFGLGLNKILATVHTYPTLAEANKYTAGQWKKAHAPQTVLAWLERFHRFRRGRPQKA